jgi:hypothetical protein
MKGVDFREIAIWLPLPINIDLYDIAEILLRVMLIIQKQILL